MLESVYDSALDPAHLQVFLEELARTLNAKSGFLRVLDEQTPAVRGNVHYNLDPELQEAHRRYYVHQDVYLQALRDYRDPFISTGERILNGWDIRHTEFFADYLRPQESYHVCGGLGLRNEQFTIMFGVQRHRRPGPFSEVDAAFLRTFVPHLRRATHLGSMLELMRQQTESAEQALESLAVGVLLLDEQEDIRHANSKADEMLRNARGLVRASGRLVAAHPADAQRLRELLALAGTRARRREPPVPEAMLLTPGEGDPKLLLVACPVTTVQSRYFQGPWPRVAVALFVSNLADAGLVSHDILIRLYGLTAAEARLACALARGHDLGELSAEWAISRETLRTHLKRVLGKTGTHRQSELVRLLTGKPWNLAGDPGPAETVKEAQP